LTSESPLAAKLAAPLKNQSKKIKAGRSAPGRVSGAARRAYRLLTGYPLRS